MTASNDHTAKAWNALNGQELFTLKGHVDGVNSTSWSPDGEKISTVGQDGIIQIYTTDIEELLSIAQSRVTRQLTDKEKEKYGVLDW